MMKPAVRDVNAFPRVLNKAAVPAFEIAASFAGTTVPSNPVETKPVIGSDARVGPGPPPRNCVVAGAPVSSQIVPGAGNHAVTVQCTWIAQEII